MCFEGIKRTIFKLCFCCRPIFLTQIVSLGVLSFILKLLNMKVVSEMKLLKQLIFYVKNFAVHSSLETKIWHQLQSSKGMYGYMMSANS